MEQHNKPVCELLCIDFCNKYEEQKSTIRELEARIAALSKDAEPINESLAEDIECIDTRYRGDPNYEHDAYYMRNAAANLVRSGYKLYTHPPAPKAITADMVTDEMVKTSVFVNVFNAKQQIANVVNAFNGVNP